VGNGRARNIEEHIVGILIYSVLFCIVLLCIAVLKNVSPMLNGDLLYVFKSFFTTMNICGNIESTRSFGI